MAIATAQQSLTADYAVLASACGLVDRSQRGRLALIGPGAAEFLNGQVTNEILRLQRGEGCYAAFLTHKGKMLGDLRVLAVSEGAEAAGLAGRSDTAPEQQTSTELLLETQRVSLQALFDMIRRFKVGFEVELHKRTLETSLLSLIGPTSRAVAARAAALLSEGASQGEQEPDGRRDLPDASSLPRAKEHSHLAAEIAGRRVRLIATSAPDGLDVLCDSEDRDAVWDALLAAGARPVAEEAAEVLRVELGVPRYGVDLDATVIPQEAGLNERAVSFTKGCYVGQETVARLYYKGKPNRQLRGLRFMRPLPCGAELRLGERLVGTLTSSVLSPVLGPIGLALLRREAEPGALLRAAPENGSATVVALPFEPPG